LIKWRKPCECPCVWLNGAHTDDNCSEDKKLSELSSLGHFLKGSSATIGLTKVKDACEKIQHYGAGKDESGTNDEPDEKVSLEKIEKTLATAKKDYKEVENFFRREYYRDEETPSSPEESKKDAKA
jgi:osomolarity two-component system phosphorelay intermediate protein YPD1